MTNSSKATVWQAVWTPWGAPHSITGSAELNLRFPGQYFQIESGLHYNWHRHYDPTTARYTQPDPLGFVDGPSRYAYAGNSPLMEVDPTGEFVVVLPALPAIVEGALTYGGYLLGGILTAGIFSMPGDDPAAIARTVTFPERNRSLWTCNCRADCDDRIPGNCSEIATRRFAFGVGTGRNFSDAVKAGKRAAKEALGCIPKHQPCSCTGPNGEKRRAQ
jgi:RHS repeat-associated protein